MRELPDGTVTFLFTDIEGSTRLLESLGDGYGEALTEHRAALRNAVGAHGGVEVDNQGDAFFFVFPDAREAVAAAAAGTEALADGRVRVRMGLHTGTPSRTDEGYFGRDVNIGARVAASAHGGQVVLTKTTRDLLATETVRDLGEHRVKDIDEPIWIYQLGNEAFPPLKTISNTNLPRPASSFIGREGEVAELQQLIRESRLVTLTGPGGSGKTRLSIEAAAELVGEFKNGVFWVPLAPLTDPALVLPAVAQAIGAPGELASDIGTRELLLVLDNLEQVIDAAPELASLVESCPHLGLLVTSRELLRVRGEVEYEVFPLADPDAVDLFTARAQLEAAPAVGELCRRLDNMPLALELAAARTKSLSVEQILERLGQRLDLFEGGRDAERRQATLRATIEWSYDLLSPEERQLFARLGVFAGGCTLESAETVADAGIRTIQSLVEKSLVRRTDDRFWMLETIREFAVERLVASGDGAIRRRHAEHFLGLAESACLCVERVGKGAMRYDIALAEQDNMRAALDWALDNDPELGLRLAIELEQFWIQHETIEGRRRFEALLGQVGVIPGELRAAALRVYGGTTQVSGDQLGGRDLYEQSRAEYERLGDEWGVIHLDSRLATVAARFDDWALARSLLESALERARALGSTYLENEALGFLASVESHDGNLDRALELARRYVELSRELGFSYFEANGLGDLTLFSLRAGRVEEAEGYGRAGLEVCLKMNDRHFGTLTLSLMALAASARGDQRAAGLLWGAVEAEEERGYLQYAGEREAARTELAAAATPELEAGIADGRRLTWEEAAQMVLAGRKQGPRASGKVSG